MSGIFSGYVNAKPCGNGMMMDKQCEIIYDDIRKEYSVIISQRGKAIGCFSVNELNKYIELDKKRRNG